MTWIETNNLSHHSLSFHISPYNESKRWLSLPNVPVVFCRWNDVNWWQNYNFKWTILLSSHINLQLRFKNWALWLTIISDLRYFLQKLFGFPLRLTVLLKSPFRYVKVLFNLFHLGTCTVYFKLQQYPRFNVGGKVNLI